MKEKKRKLLDLYVNTEMSYQELSEAINTPVLTVSNWIEKFTVEDLKSAMKVKAVQPMKAPAKIVQLNANPSFYTYENLSPSEKKLFDNLETEDTA